MPDQPLAQLLLELFTAIKMLSGYPVPETLPEVLRLSLEHVNRSRLEPGCLLHSVHRDVEDPNRVVFLEVREPGRIAYLHGEPGEPDHFFATVILDDEGGKTRLSMRSLFPSAADRDRIAEEYGAIEGMESTIDELAAFLAARSGEGRQA